MVERYKQIHDYCELCNKYNHTKKYKIIKRLILKDNIKHILNVIYSSWSMYTILSTLASYICATELCGVRFKSNSIDIRFYNDRIDIFYNSHETNITYYIAKEKVNISYILTEFEIGTDGIIAIPRLQMIYDNVIEGIIKEAAITSLILLGGLSWEILK